MGAAGGELRAGFGREVISPPAGVGLAGYFAPRPNRGVLDDLHARAAVFRNGATAAGILSLDLITVTAELARAVRREVSALDAGLARNLLIAATHTHTGPRIRPAEDASAAAVIEHVAAGSASAVGAALEEMAPASLRAGSVSENPFAFCRRYRMKGGGVTTNPGKLNPGILGPEGDVDREIGLLAVERGGATAGLIANIVNHTDTVGGHMVSADWPGFLEEGLRRRLGGDVSVISLIGASGDVNHFDVASPEPQTSYDEAEHIGSGYADIVWRALDGLAEFDGAPLAAGRARTDLSKRSIPPEELAAARELLSGPAAPAAGAATSEDLARGDEAVRRFFAAELVRFAETEAGRGVAYEMLALRLGRRLAVVGLPGEPFTAIGARVKAGSPFETTLVASHAGDSFGYIPLPECFERGGYEVLARPGAGMSPGTAGALVECALRALSS